jgi:hypothetical protein
MFKYRLVGQAVLAMCAQAHSSRVEGRLAVRESANHPSAPLDLAQDALQVVIGVEAPPMLPRESCS